MVCGDLFLLSTRIILGMYLTNERGRYIVTSSLLGWAHGQNDPFSKGWFTNILQDYFNGSESLIIVPASVKQPWRIWENVSLHSTKANLILQPQQNSTTSRVHVLWDISPKIALGWLSLDVIDDESTVVQVMAWCRQATSYYLNQCSQDQCHHMASLGRYGRIAFTATHYIDLICA